MSDDKKPKTTTNEITIADQNKVITCPLPDVRKDADNEVAVCSSLHLLDREVGANFRSQILSEVWQSNKFYGKQKSLEVEARALLN